MSAVAAAAEGQGKMAFNSCMSSIPGASRSSNPAWQLVVVRTRTVGVTGAGGVAAHRKHIMEGMRSVRNLNEDSLVEGYRQRSVRGWPTSTQATWTIIRLVIRLLYFHRRLDEAERAEQASPENGHPPVVLASTISIRHSERTRILGGGCFVPERTFCVVPPQDQPAGSMFSRHVIKKAGDEMKAHMSMFRPEKNTEYERMIDEAASLVVK